MAATPSVKIVKTFQYKGVPRQWSNRYHFLGGTPVDAAHWHTLFDNVTAAEKAVLDSSCEIVEAIGYAAGSDVPVATKSYTLTGTGAWVDHKAPGDAAALVRYATDVRTSKNHPVYLFNYYHSAFAISNLSPDNIETDYQAALLSYANAWISPGFSDGSVTYNRAGPNGAAAIGAIVEGFLTHRDFPR